MRSALSYIQNGYFREGLNVLEQVKDRRGPWYYYSAFANYKVGNNAVALEHAKAACAFEPNNFYYASLLNQLEGGESQISAEKRRLRRKSVHGAPELCGADMLHHIVPQSLLRRRSLHGRHTVVLLLVITTFKSACHHGFSSVVTFFVGL